MRGSPSRFAQKLWSTQARPSVNRNGQTKGCSYDAVRETKKRGLWELARDCEGSPRRRRLVPAGSQEAAAGFFGPTGVRKPAMGQSGR